MKHLTATFSALLIFFLGIALSQTQNNFPLSHETKTYGVELAGDKPEFASFWVDSLGNMQLLDRWREEIGLVYEQDEIF